MTTATEFVNSFVTIHNKEIDIHYRKTNFRVAIDKVTKMYLTKKKSKYAAWIPGSRFFLDYQYNLCIKTRDNQEISMDVKASERQYFIAPISFVKNLKKNTPVGA